MFPGNVPKSILYVLIFFLFTACSQERAVKEHFHNHGLFYPVDNSGIGLWNIQYIGIGKEELSAPGAREFVERGVQFSKEFFVRNKIQNYIPGSVAVILSRPVLFKDDAGKVGLMVEVTAFGSAEPPDTISDTMRWLGSDRELWSVENFAYFGRNDLYQWEYKGMVFE